MQYLSGIDKTGWNESSRLCVTKERNTQQWTAACNLLGLAGHKARWNRNA
jgi:hypothetical protein